MGDKKSIDSMQDEEKMLKLFEKLHNERYPKPPKIEKIFKNQKGRCDDCGFKIKLDTAVEDYLIPISKEGKNVKDNKRLICEQCKNIKKEKILLKCRRPSSIPIFYNQSYELYTNGCMALMGPYIYNEEKKEWLKNNKIIVSSIHLKGVTQEKFQDLIIRAEKERESTRQLRLYKNLHIRKKISENGEIVEILEPIELDSPINPKIPSGFAYFITGDHFCPNGLTAEESRKLYEKKLLVPIVHDSNSNIEFKYNWFDFWCSKAIEKIKSTYSNVKRKIELFYVERKLSILTCIWYTENHSQDKKKYEEGFFDENFKFVRSKRWEGLEFNCADLTQVLHSHLNCYIPTYTGRKVKFRKIYMYFNPREDRRSKFNRMEIDFDTKLDDIKIRVCILGMENFLEKEFEDMCVEAQSVCIKF